jgi:hypothetical protein
MQNEWLQGNEQCRAGLDIQPARCSLQSSQSLRNLRTGSTGIGAGHPYASLPRTSSDGLTAQQKSPIRQTHPPIQRSPWKPVHSRCASPERDSVPARYCHTCCRARMRTGKPTPSGRCRTRRTASCALDRQGFLHWMLP